MEHGWQGFGRRARKGKLWRLGAQLGVQPEGGKGEAAMAGHGMRGEVVGWYLLH